MLSARDRWLVNKLHHCAQQPCFCPVTGCLGGVFWEAPAIVSLRDQAASIGLALVPVTLGLTELCLLPTWGFGKKSLAEKHLVARSFSGPTSLSGGSKPISCLEQEGKGDV